MSYQLINDAGYPKYAAVLSVIPENIDTYSECLTALVPVLQQATVDFFADPQPTIDLILELVDAYDTGWVYSQGVAEFSVDTMLSDGIAGNDADGAMGTVDATRMTDLFDLVTPIYTEQGLPVKDGVSVDDIWTDQFLDSSITF